MKDFVGGRATTACVSCMDTPGYWNAHGNVMCMSVPAGTTCTESYGTGSNGLSCGNASTMTYNFYSCPVV